MESFFTSLMLKADRELHYLRTKYPSKEREAEEACKMLQVAYARLENFELSHVFSSAQEEITYYKVLKPKIGSQLIYFSGIYHIESERPKSGLRAGKEYLLRELEKIRDYFEDNIGFVCYYRSNENYLDHLYFQRKMTYPGQVSFSTRDPEKGYSVNYEFKAAKLLANDLLHTYLRDQLRALDEPAAPPVSTIPPRPDLKWSESKSALVELIYAIRETGALNFGKADIKEIAELCERTFHVKLGDYYRTFNDMRGRKTGRTKFLDTLRSALIARMEEQETRLV